MASKGETTAPTQRHVPLGTLMGVANTAAVAVDAPRRATGPYDADPAAERLPRGYPGCPMRATDVLRARPNLVKMAPLISENED